MLIKKLFKMVIDLGTYLTIKFSFPFVRGGSQRPKLRWKLRISNNTLSDLIIFGEINTSMGQLEEEIGEPEYIISGNNVGGGRTVILIDSQSGISYWYITELNNLEVAPDTLIDCLGIFDPSLYKEMLDAGFFSNGDYNAEETLKVWYPWNGYGNLDEKYPTRQLLIDGLVVVVAVKHCCT